MKAGRLAGHYFNALAVGSITWMLVGPILGQPLLLDFSFILYFWVGFGLLNRRKGFRTGALVMLSLVVLFCAGYLISLIWATGPVSSRGALRTPLLASVHAGILLLVFLPPLILLLLPGTRRWFAEGPVPPAQRFVLRGRLIGVYVLISLAFDAGGALLHRATLTAKPYGWMQTYTYGNEKLGMISIGGMEDAKGRQINVAWFAIGESDTYGSPHDGHVRFGSNHVAVPDLKPVRYLGSLPQARDQAGNVVLVRGDGTVIRLARRVTPDQLDAARDAINGAKDLEEVRRRLESMLPNSEVAAK